MSRYTKIPEHARVVGVIEGPAGVLVVCEGEASDGYKTGYERRPAFWWQVRSGGRVIETKRFSGKNVPALIEAWNEVAADPQLTVQVATGVLSAEGQRRTARPTPNMRKELV